MNAAHLQTAVSMLSALSQIPALQSTQKPAVPSNAPAATNPTTSATLNALTSVVPTAPKNIPAPSTTTTVTTNTTPASSPPVTSNLCDNCHLRPKYQDGTKTHPFCGKTCAAAKANIAAANSTNNSTKSTNCDVCQKRPKYFDGKQTHSYCSKACAKNSKAGGTHQRKGSSSKGPSNRTSSNGCQIDGCRKPCFVDSNGKVSEYCSLAHKSVGETVCIMCRKVAKETNSHFCGAVCADQAEKQGPIILEVPVGHVTFKSVAKQFRDSWRHSTSPPKVQRVYKIVSPQTSLTSYNAYRAAVEARGQFVASGRSAGNENRRWHGTKRECNLGDKGQTQFCASATCSLCCIVRTSFDLSLFGKKTGWGRFGKGIYTSSTSSKSNDYASNACQSNLKAILLNKVCVGKGCKMLQDNSTLTAPPPGFDSVLAEKGGTLNHDELVVYDNDAIRPSFLVMYDA